MEINNLILDLNRCDANQAPGTKMTVREFSIIIFMGIYAAFVDLPPIKTLFQTGQASVSGVVGVGEG